MFRVLNFFKLLVFGSMAGAVLFLIDCGGREIFSRTPISGKVSVGPDWYLLPLENPFRPIKKTQNICAEFSERLQTKDGIWKPVLENGTVLTIDVLAIDEEGNEHRMNRVASISEKKICFEKTSESNWIDTLPRNRSYKGIKMRSDHLIELDGVYWYGYNQENSP